MTEEETRARARLVELFGDKRTTWPQMEHAIDALVTACQKPPYIALVETQSGVCMYGPFDSTDAGIGWYRSRFGQRVDALGCTVAMVSDPYGG